MAGLGGGWMDVGMYTCVCVDGWVRWMDGCRYVYMCMCGWLG